MANILTAVRLLLVIPVALAFAWDEFLTPVVLIGLIIVAILSDYFDGIVARRTNAASATGQLFDHATDFVFVTACLAGVAYADQGPVILPVLIAVAFSQYVLDSYFLYREKQLRMSFLGRWNGVFYFVPLVLIALSRSELWSGFGMMLSHAALYLSYGLVATTIASIIDRAIAPLRSRPMHDSQTC